VHMKCTSCDHAAPVGPLHMSREQQTFGAWCRLLQVPMMRQAILDSVPDWQLFAQRQRETVFAPGASAAAAQRRRDKMLAAIDFMCGSIEHDAPEATQNGNQVWLCLGGLDLSSACSAASQQLDRTHGSHDKSTRFCSKWSSVYRWRGLMQTPDCRRMAKQQWMRSSMSGSRCSRQPACMPTGRHTTCTSTAMQTQSRLPTRSESFTEHAMSQSNHKQSCVSTGSWQALSHLTICIVSGRCQYRDQMGHRPYRVPAACCWASLMTPKRERCPARGASA
jgi:hypothetical protein